MTKKKYIHLRRLLLLNVIIKIEFVNTLFEGFFLSTFSCGDLKTTVTIIFHTRKSSLPVKDCSIHLHIVARCELNEYQENDHRIKNAIYDQLYRSLTHSLADPSQTNGLKCGIELLDLLRKGFSKIASIRVQTVLGPGLDVNIFPSRIYFILFY